MVCAMVQTHRLCLVALSFDFCLTLAPKLAGEGSWLPPSSWISCHLSIKLLSALFSSLTSGYSIFSVFHSGFVGRSSNTFLSCSSSVCDGPVLSQGPRLQFEVFDVQHQSSNLLSHSFTFLHKHPALKNNILFMFSVKSSTPHMSQLSCHDLALAAVLTVFLV